MQKCVVPHLLIAQVAVRNTRHMLAQLAGEARHRLRNRGVEQRHHPPLQLQRFPTRGQQLRLQLRRARSLARKPQQPLRFAPPLCLSVGM